MTDEEDAFEHYKQLVQKEGIGALNDVEDAHKRELEDHRDRISTIVEFVAEKIDFVYSEDRISSEQKNELLEWIEAGIDGDAPGLYFEEKIAGVNVYQNWGLERGECCDSAQRVMPDLLLKDDENRERWSSYWLLVHDHRKKIKALEKRLRTIESVRKSMLWSDQKLEKEHWSLRDRSNNVDPEPSKKPSYITDPPEDLFKGSGSKDRVKAKKYARQLAELYADKTVDIPDQKKPLYAMLKGETGGRNMVKCVENAFGAHPETEKPETTELLCEACYHFFPNITLI